MCAASQCEAPAPGPAAGAGTVLDLNPPGGGRCGAGPTPGDPWAPSDPPGSGQPGSGRGREEGGGEVIGWAERRG